MTPKAIVTDIEGTTSSIAFVHDVLFPYARERLADYVMAHEDMLTAILDAVRAEVGNAELDTAGYIATLLDWHDADRKIGPLKSLQGMIWADGYAAGALKGHVYGDAVLGLRRWHDMGIALYVYSSGSVAAQKLIFGHSDYGDLTGLFDGYFDTGVGGKRKAASYAAIVTAIGLDAADILFLSDVAEELAAAQAAGMAVALLDRDGAGLAASYPTHRDFDSIVATESVA